MASTRVPKTRPTAAQAVSELSHPRWCNSTTSAAPMSAGTAYSSRWSTSGTRRARTSRRRPPPTAVMPPMRVAASGPASLSRATSAPLTANTPSPAASSTRTADGTLPPARVGVAPCELLPPSVEEEDEQPGDDRGREEPPVADTDRRRDAEEQVAQDAPTEARDPGEDEDPEEVQTDPHCHERTGQREDEDPDEVEAELERGGVRQHRAILPATRLPARAPPERRS